VSTQIAAAALMEGKETATPSSTFPQYRSGAGQSLAGYAWRAQSHYSVGGPPFRLPVDVIICTAAWRAVYYRRRGAKLWECTMPYRKFFLAAAVLAASVIPAAAQGPGLFGFYDPATGAFTPVQPPVAAPAAGVQPASTVSRGGIFKFKITLKIVSILPSGTKPYCSASVNHSAGNLYYSESVSTNVTPSGNTAICNLRIPYLWPSANNASGVSVSIYTSAGNRSGNQNLPSIPLPPDATTTNLQATVRL
jgi:hypothetical protein